GAAVCGGRARPEPRHDLRRARAGLGETAPGSLAQAMRLAVARQPGGRDGAAQPVAETADPERRAERRGDDDDVLALGAGEHGLEFTRQAEPELLAGLLLHEADAVARDVRPRHPTDVATTLPRAQHQLEGQALLGADRPARAELRDLGFSPGADFAALRPPQTQRRIG